MPTTNTARKVARTGQQTTLDLHSKASASFRLITPDDAQAYLAKLAPNRPQSRPVIRLYAARKRQGLWRDYQHDPIILDPDGAVWNAQHRLQAIIETQISCVMLVVAYHDWAPMEGLELTIDRGKQRSTRDVLSIGLRKPITTNQAACARSLYYGIQAAMGQIPDLVFISFYRRHHEAIETACRLLNPHRKHLSLAPIAAGLAAALGHAVPDKIARFAEVLLGGKSLTRPEHTITSLRDWLIAHPPSGGGQKSAEVYARTTQALRDFLDERLPGRITPARQELFPLRRTGEDPPPSLGPRRP
jgi:hypothetical protein